MQMKRPHPLFWIYDARKWLLVLAFLVLNTVLSQKSLVNTVLASVRDVGISLLLISYSGIKWNFARYSVNKNIIFRQGLIFRRKLHVTTSDVSCVEVECTPLMRLLRGRRVRINTAGLKRKSDATLYVPVSTLKSGRLYNPPPSGDRYKVKFFPYLFLCASSSNAAIGFLTAVPIIREASNLVGAQFSDNVYSAFGRLISLDLPPLLDSVANFFLIGWGLSFVINLFTNARFFSQRDSNRLYISAGLISRREIYIDTLRITTLQFRQTLFMKLFSLQTASITAAGYGRNRGVKPVIIPAATPKELARVLDALMPEYPTAKISVTPSKKSFFGYVFLPLIVIFSSLIPLFVGGIWKMVFFVLIVAGAWWLSICVFGFLRAGFGINKRAIGMRFSRGLALYEIHIPIEVVDCISVNQNVFQKMSGSCTIKLESYKEQFFAYKLSGMPYLQSIQLAEKFTKFSK